MKSAGKARNNGLCRHIRTSKEIIRNLLNDYYNKIICGLVVQSKGVSEVGAIPNDGGKRIPDG